MNVSPAIAAITLLISLLANAQTPSPAPVLVIGKHPQAKDSTPPSTVDRPDPVVMAPNEETPKLQNGPVVRIEKLHDGTGNIDPTQVKLRAPFPAKLLAQVPTGWRLDISDSAPPFTREVELAPGSKITLTIRPHLLIPDADNARVFTIAEPGYDSSLGYQQTDTVGAILANSIRQLDENAKRLGTAIDNLQQLLVSLPKPESPQEPKAILLRKP